MIKTFGNEKRYQRALLYFLPFFIPPPPSPPIHASQGLLNLDEQIVISQTINSECDHVRHEIRESVKTDTPMPWKLLTSLLRKRIDGFADLVEKSGENFKGIVIGIEARQK